MRLHHLHLPGLTPYSTASTIQERLIQRFFSYKDDLRASLRSASLPQDLPPEPTPSILTFSTPPTYTVGRRYLAPSSRLSINPSQIAFLQGLTSSQINPLAAFHLTPRGGDLTYHGPGQLIAYPILDLRTHALTPRAYVSLLETTVIRTCTALGVPNTMTTSNPGVWMVGGEAKICSVGVQVRRGITGHGIGLNVADGPAEKGEGYEVGDGKGDGMLSWGFERIVACGLEGKSVTWLGREGARSGIGVEEVAGVFVDDFARGLRVVNEVLRLGQDEIEENNEGDKVGRRVR